MDAFKKSFIEFLLNSDVLKFGDFTTKSGRQTPYFINTGEFKTGEQMNTLAGYYAGLIAKEFPSLTNLYGPAYKGIPLCVAASMKLSTDHNINPTYTFNRKEAKDHGEGGVLVGKKYEAEEKVVIIEDVITAGTSVRETMELFKTLDKADVIGLVISVDRQEKVGGDLSAVQEVSQEYGIETKSVISILDIIEYIEDDANRKAFGIGEGMIDKMKAYRSQYGI